jgi:hypothetical protein
VFHSVVCMCRKGENRTLTIYKADNQVVASGESFGLPLRDRSLQQLKRHLLEYPADAEELEAALETSGNVIVESLLPPALQRLAREEDGVCACVRVFVVCKLP